MASHMREPGKGVGKNKQTLLQNLPPHYRVINVEVLFQQEQTAAWVIPAAFGQW